MKKENGVYTTPCTVNGLKLRFIFDTGASNVSLSISEAIFMLKNGYLNESDIHGSSYSQIANGEVIENTTVTLKEFEVGGIMLYDVEAIIIHELSAPLLLGQSAIKKLGKIQLEGDELVIINNAPSSLDEVNETEFWLLIVKGKGYYFDELYSLAASTLQKAYDTNPKDFRCTSGFLLAESYLNIKNYELATKGFYKVLKCQSDPIDLTATYISLSRLFFETGDYVKSTINIEQALSHSTEQVDQSICYNILGDISYAQNKYTESNLYFEKSIALQLQIDSLTNNDVMRGKVKNYFLGRNYYDIAFNYRYLNQQNSSDKYMIKAALCGYEDAIKECKKRELRYEMYIE